MTQVGPYTFRHATTADLDRLNTWRQAPHVTEWWGTEEVFDAEDFADPRVAPWIVSCENQPFAYIQDYTVHGWENHPFAHLPDGSRGIDQFIGPGDMIGLGHGTAFIGARVRALFDAGAPVVATDPHPDNARAIAVYKKLGFEPSGVPKDTEWGRILPMEITR